MHKGEQYHVFGVIDLVLDMIINKRKNNFAPMGISFKPFVVIGGLEKLAVKQKVELQRKKESFSLMNTQIEMI